MIYLVSSISKNENLNSVSIWNGHLLFLAFLNFFCINRAECTENPVRLFAILSMQRSGSGWFETLLNSHINVSSNGEIFSVMDRRKNISSIVQTLDKVYNLDWFTSASKNECSAAVGFKWMLNQVNSLFKIFGLTKDLSDHCICGSCKILTFDF